MKRNLFGEMMAEPSDYVNNIIADFQVQKHHSIHPNFSTRQGFSTDDSYIVPDIGIYCIFKNFNPIYVGYSNHSIRQRIGRFLAVVRQTNRYDEDHPGARKYVKQFGADTEDLTFKVFDFDTSILPEYISVEDIESELIYTLKTQLNKQVYKGTFVDSLRITL